MACLVPDAQMSAEERACCRMMKNQCGQMEMPESHGCCQKAAQSGQIIPPVTKRLALHRVAVNDVWLSATELLDPITVASERVGRHEYSPPLSPPSTVSILRI
jgi:hypothetical protein